MELLVWNPVEFQRLYNCSVYRVDDVPFGQRREYAISGISYILLFLIFELLYLPCLVSVYRHRNHSCYKIMLFIGIVDVFGLVVCALLPGIFSITGMVFCSCPEFMFAVGVAGYVLLSTETMAAILLAANRCLSVAMPSVAKKMFKGNRTWVWLLVPTAYSLWFGFHSKPAIFSAIFGAWHLFPHIGYIQVDDKMFVDYYTPYDFYHEVIIIVGLGGFYASFLLLLFLQRWKYTANNNKTSSQNSLGANANNNGVVVHKSKESYQINGLSKWPIFLQVLVLSAVNAANASLYIVAGYIEVGRVFVYFATYWWIICHGIPPLIYLTMNHTMQRDFIQMIGQFGKTKAASGNLQIQRGEPRGIMQMSMPMATNSNKKNRATS